MMSVAYDFAHSPATEFMSRPQHLLIDGRRVPASSGRTFKSLNPATGQVIAIVAEGNEADVEHAVAAARRAFEGPWRTMRASERGQILLRWADLLKQHAEEIIELEIDRCRQADRRDVAAGFSGRGRHADLLRRLGRQDQRRRRARAR